MLREGVSPIISTVLMTAIVVVLGTAIFIWGAVTLGSLTEGISFFNTLSSEKLREDFIIEHITLTSPRNITIYVRNIGFLEIKLSSLYVYNSDNTSQISYISLDSYGYKVLVGQLFNTTIELPVSWSWTSGDVYKVKLVTSRGNSYETEVRA